MRYLTGKTSSVDCEDLAAVAFAKSLAAETGKNIAVAKDATGGFVVAHYDMYVYAGESLNLVEVLYP
jgi:hypothetical protein